MQGYDEAHWATVLHYDRPIEASLAVLRAVRAASSELLDTLVEDGFALPWTDGLAAPAVAGVSPELTDLITFQGAHRDLARQVVEQLQTAGAALVGVLRALLVGDVDERGHEEHRAEHGDAVPAMRGEEGDGDRPARRHGVQLPACRRDRRADLRRRRPD